MDLKVSKSLCQFYLKLTIFFKKIFNLVKDSKAFWTARERSIKITRNIQPSITDEDLKIASDMQLACASALLLNLIREGLISINKKEE